jgi:hypothetical protein
VFLQAHIHALPIAQVAEQLRKNLSGYERTGQGSARRFAHGTRFEVNVKFHHLPVFARRIATLEKELEKMRLRAVDDAHTAELHFKKSMEDFEPPIVAVQGALEYLEALASGISNALEHHDAQWQALVSCKEEQHDELLVDRDELQSRHDWVLTRWSAREPRQQDVRMISALQDELSRNCTLSHSITRQVALTSVAAATHIVCVWGALISCAPLLPMSAAALSCHSVLANTQANAHDSTSGPNSAAVQRGAAN